MDFTRRQFIQVTGATAAGLAVSGLGFDLRPIKAHAQMLKTEYAKQTTSICPYCAVGCGVIVHTDQKGAGRVINLSKASHVYAEDPEAHPDAKPFGTLTSSAASFAIISPSDEFLPPTVATS